MDEKNGPKALTQTGNSFVLGNHFTLQSIKDEVGKSQEVELVNDTRYSRNLTEQEQETLANADVAIDEEAKVA